MIVIIIIKINNKKGGEKMNKEKRKNASKIGNAYVGDIVCPKCADWELYNEGLTEKGELKLGCDNCGFVFKENDCLIDKAKRIFVN